MENEKTLTGQMKDQAAKSINLYKTKINNGDEINIDGWKDNFERHARLLKKCGVSDDDAVMIELSDITSVLNGEPGELEQLIEMRRAGGCGDVLTHLLCGRDSMLVPVRDLDDAALRLARLGCSTTEDNRVELFMMQSYLDGIIHARLCQIAAGLEPVAA